MLETSYPPRGGPLKRAFDKINNNLSGIQFLFHAASIPVAARWQHRCHHRASGAARRKGRFGLLQLREPLLLLAARIGASRRGPGQLPAAPAPAVSARAFAKSPWCPSASASVRTVSTVGTLTNCLGRNRAFRGRRPCCHQCDRADGADRAADFVLERVAHADDPRSGMSFATKGNLDAQRRSAGCARRSRPARA
jgi:hypothetical protein